MKKITVLFPKVEAGMGHIMTNDAVAEIFEKKYGKLFNIINIDFYKSSKSEKLHKFGDFLCKNVYHYTRDHIFGHFATFSGEFWGTRISMYFTMHFGHKGAVKDGVQYMNQLKPDVVFSTHWATNYYAQKMENKPLTIMYCPDATLNKLFKSKCDYSLISTQMGLKKAQKDKFYNSSNLSLVPFCIRNKAFELKLTKQEAREKLNIPNRFTVLLTEGGYGNGKMEKIVKRLLELDLPINVVAICGKNPAKFERLSCLETKGNTFYVCRAFEQNIFTYMKASDLFCGKAGNMIAEPTFFGIPSIISGLSTYIENNLCKFYVRDVKCAILEKNPKKVCELIDNFSKNPEKLKPFTVAAINHKKDIGAEIAADFIYDKITESFGDKYELPRRC